MIHGQYIKGAYNTPHTGTGNNTTLYTFIDYYGGKTLTSTIPDESYLPHICISDNTDRNATGAIEHDLGHIVTTGIDQSFDGRVNIYGTLGTYSISTPDDDDDNGLGLDTSTSTVYIGYDFSRVDFLAGVAGFNSTSAGFDIPMTVSGYFKVGNPSSGDTSAGTIVGKNIYSDGLCQAQYFDATSDRRAKIDIKPINKSVLPLVTNTQLYSFKYKDLDTPSIGIIAQDVQDVDFDGFSLVDNKEATGQDMDYMSIHESKLVYVLWKAIQEQQKEIEELKEQIKKGL